MGIPDALAADGTATRPDVVAHAESLRHHATQLGLAPLHIHDDGTLVIHSDQTGYKTANQLSPIATQVVGVCRVSSPTTSPERQQHKRVTGEEALTDLVATHEQIPDLVPADKSPCNSDLVQRLAIERLWITASNCAQQYPTGKRDLRGPRM